jgi:hypothetical protein
LRNKIGKEKEKGRKMERDIEMGDTEIRRRTDTEGSRIVHPVCNVSRGNGGDFIAPIRIKSSFFVAAVPLAQRCTGTKIPFMYSFSGNCTAPVPISTFMCL